MENKVLATISGVEITEANLNSIINRYPEDKRTYFNSEAGRKQLLEQLISFELMNNLGLEMKINETEEYKQGLAQVEKDLLTQLTINKVLSEVTITDTDAKKYYDENGAEFVQPATVTAKHILVADEEKCLEVKKNIESGELTFEDAAKKYSTCPSKEQGGSLGAFRRGMMVPEFEDVAFASDLEKVSEPVKTQFGYHLIKVEAKSEPSSISFEQVKPQLISRLSQQAQEKKYSDVIKNLQTKYEVKRF